MWPFARRVELAPVELTEIVERIDVIAYPRLQRQDHLSSNGNGAVETKRVERMEEYFSLPGVPQTFSLQLEAKAFYLAQGKLSLPEEMAARGVGDGVAFVFSFPTPASSPSIYALQLHDLRQEPGSVYSHYSPRMVIDDFLRKGKDKPLSPRPTEEVLAALQDYFFGKDHDSKRKQIQQILRQAQELAVTDYGKELLGQLRQGVTTFSSKAYQYGFDGKTMQLR